METRPHIESEAEPGRIKKLILKFGFWGFMFFFIKGLLWLIIPALVAYGVISW